MRIFAAVRHSNDPRLFYGGLWSGNFYPALRQLGHEIVESQTDLLPTSRFMHIAGSFTPEEIKVRASTTEQILGEVRAALATGPIDLFLSYFYNSHFDPAGFDELRRLGIPSVNFYCNSTYQFPLVAGIAAKVDFAWHAERDARASYLAVGANPVWVQMAADPQVYHPIDGAMRASKTVFVGQNYADRPRWAAALVAAGVPIDIYGFGWVSPDPTVSANQCSAEAPATYLGRATRPPTDLSKYATVVLDAFKSDGPAAPVRLARRWGTRRRNREWLATCAPHAMGSSADIVATLSSYELCLNFSNVWADGHPGSRLIPHIRLRDFEAPMCRACYLTGHTDELEEFYRVGTELDTYRSEAELIDKARFYLRHPDAAERLREAGWRRATRDHTWNRRFAELFAKIRTH